MALRRRAEDAGGRQSEGGSEESGLVRSGAESEGAVVLRALRHGDVADQAVHAASQGEDRTGHRLRPGQRLERPAVWDTGRGERSPADVGDGRGGHADSRHDAQAGGQGVRGDRGQGVAAAAARAVPFVPRSPAQRPPRRPRGGVQCVLLGAPGIRGPSGLGALGRPSGAGVQPTHGGHRGACATGSRAVQHAGQAHPCAEVLPGRARRRGLVAGDVVDRPRRGAVGQSDAGRPGNRRSADPDGIAGPDETIHRSRDRPGVRRSVEPRDVPPAADPGVADPWRGHRSTTGATRVPG